MQNLTTKQVFMPAFCVCDHMIVSSIIVVFCYCVGIASWVLLAMSMLISSFQGGEYSR